MINNENIESEIRGFTRDKDTGALLATDSKEFLRYKNRKNQRNRIEKLEEVVCELNSEILELKELLASWSQPSA